MDGEAQLVVVVDDDAGMRRALQRLLRVSGYRALAFASAEAFVAAGGAHGAACLVLDVQLPGGNGTELYARLGPGRPPAVFVTSWDHAAVQRAVAALDALLLFKPFGADELLDAVAAAIRCPPPG